MKTRTLTMILILAAAGCAKAPPVPTDDFYRLPPPHATQTTKAPWTDGILRVRPLRADGLHSDRALLYTEDPKGTMLKRYAYHLWVDPPPKMVQQQLADYLRAIGAARMVVTQVDTNPDLVVSGRIERFERQVLDSGVTTHVELQLQLDDGRGKPLLLKDYAADVPAADDGIMATVNAIDEGLNRIYGQFATDVSDVLSRRTAAP